MKQLTYITLALVIILAGCKEDEKFRTSGTDTIDNVRYKSTTWFTYGFSFSTGKLVSTETSQPDITVDTSLTERPNVLLSGRAGTSFHKFGDYPDEASAKAAFEGLKTVTATTWEDWANPVLPHQVWIFRSSLEKYTKIRIVNIVQRKEQGIPLTELTFQWVHQPDGSLIFP